MAKVSAARLVTPRGLTLASLAALTIAASLAAHQPWLLANTTPSEPPGLYMRTSQPPAAGRLIAFRAPPAAFPYADRRLGYLHRTPVLKTIAAGPGDQVCTHGGRLTINGRDRAAITPVDRFGVALPHWEGCRPLVAGELFVFSNRVPNSFDSRYFGPVQQDRILGVYTAITWPWEAR
jgi:conjugative transfer signal peptidase TraF